MEIGQRVKIYIYDPKRWALGAVECLNGLTGVIKEIKKQDTMWENYILVEFDEPAKTWHSFQTPWESAWFRKEDLLIEIPAASWRKKEDLSL